MKILFIDTETTGTDPQRNEVVEIGAIYYEDGIEKSRFEVKLQVSSKNEINIAALKVNKYLENDMSKLMDRTDAVLCFVDYLLKLPGDRQNPIHFGGHNVAFDILAIKKLLTETEYNFVGLNELFSYSVKDSSTVANFLRDAGIINLERMSLERLSKALDIQVDSTRTHSAIYDAELSAKCYFKMLELIKPKS